MGFYKWQGDFLDSDSVRETVHHREAACHNLDNYDVELQKMIGSASSDHYVVQLQKIIGSASSAELQLEEVCAAFLILPKLFFLSKEYLSPLKISFTAQIYI